MKKILSKKARKVIEDGVQEFMGLPPRMKPWLKRREKTLRLVFQ